MVKLNQQKLPSLSESKLLHILHFLNFNLLLARFNVCTTKEKFNYLVKVQFSEINSILYFSNQNLLNFSAALDGIIKISSSNIPEEHKSLVEG